MRPFAAGCWLLVLLLVGAAGAADLPTLAGPAMGTTYRVTLAADISGMNRGQVHREVEAVLARIDRAASTWRDDSDASRFNLAAAGEWVTVSPDLMALVETARGIHEQSEGAFDVTVGPLVRLWGDGRVEPSDAAIAVARGCVGMRSIESRPHTSEVVAALRKTRHGVEIDLSGIAPGYAVDRIGERLLELGSAAHLVELGGEVRAWGQPAEGRPWRVWLRDADAGQGQPRRSISTMARRSPPRPADRAALRSIPARAGRWQRPFPADPACPSGSAARRPCGPRPVPRPTPGPSRRSCSASSRMQTARSRHHPGQRARLQPDEQPHEDRQR
jgi:thiamine biosynthesis lipoprotein ApbE